MFGVAEVLAALGAMSPLAVIALLGIIIFMLVKGKKQVEAVSDNHLSDLPEIAKTLARIETVLAKEFSYIRARLNGK